MATKYVYFVSFSHDKGFGMADSTTNQVIQDFGDVKALAALIESRSTYRSVIPLWWTILRVEEIDE
jgi:hypothetical protein